MLHVPAVTRFLPTVSPEDLKGAASLAQATELFLLSGALRLEKLLEPGLVQTLHDAYLERYDDYLEGPAPADCLVVGDKRRMIGVHLQPPFDVPQVYAPPALCELLESLLGPGFILLSFGSVSALPGAKAQEPHVDHPPLFDEAESLGAALPCYAITVVIPLCDHTPETGTTRIWPQSHLQEQCVQPETEAIDVFTEAGSAYLIDYRTWHSGTPNRAKHARPALYVVYTRPWFRDAVNYGSESSLKMTEQAYRDVPDAHRHLFRWRFLRSCDSAQ